ncbi:MAG: phosphatidylglycerophosphatase A [Bacteroidetes bacterium]|nr:phosphatidylglycerophosphatase A [Bacteroidota bacterium]
MNDSGPEGQDSIQHRPIPFFHRFVATGFFSGYVPWASGTVGTLVGLLIYLIPGVESVPLLSGLIVAGFFAGVISSARVAAAVGNQLTRTAEIAKTAFQPHGHATADPSIVVIDEIVGMWVTLLFLPKTLPVMVIGFVAFRVMDILKPQPARYLERLPGGWGIMLDDLAAGIYANAITWGGWLCWQWATA